MAAPTATPPITVPPEVHTFAAESGVAPYLPAVLELTPRVFPTARRYAVVVTDDPEIANDRHIVFIVEVALDIPQAQAAEERWIEGLYACCPAPLVHVFRLSMDLVP
jgi:hypothetical protein